MAAAAAARAEWGHDDNDDVAKEKELAIKLRYISNNLPVFTFYWIFLMYKIIIIVIIVI